MRFFCTPNPIRTGIEHLRRMLHFHLCYKGILRSYQNLNLDSIVRSDKFFQLNYKTSYPSNNVLYTIENSSPSTQ